MSVSCGVWRAIRRIAPPLVRDAGARISIQRLPSRQTQGLETRDYESCGWGGDDGVGQFLPNAEIVILRHGGGTGFSRQE